MLIHRPIFRSKEEETRSYVVCGEIAVNWGPVEQAIESILILLRTIQRDARDTPFPVSLSRKISELKQRIKSDRVPADVRVDLTRLMPRVKTIHQTRTIVVHGICQGTNLKGEIMFGVSRLNDGISYTPRALTHAKLQRDADDMALLARDLISAFTQIRMSDVRG